MPSSRRVRASNDRSCSTRRRAASARAPAAAGSVSDAVDGRAQGPARHARRRAARGPRPPRARACRRRRSRRSASHRHGFEHGVRRAFVLGRLHEEIEGVVQIGDVEPMAEQRAATCRGRGPRPAPSSSPPQAAVADDDQPQRRVASAPEARTPRGAGRSASAARGGPTAPMTTSIGPEAELAPQSVTPVRARARTRRDRWRSESR